MFTAISMNQQQASSPTTSRASQAYNARMGAGTDLQGWMWGGGRGGRGGYPPSNSLAKNKKKIKNIVNIIEK